MIFYYHYDDIYKGIDKVKNNKKLLKEFLFITIGPHFYSWQELYFLFMPNQFRQQDEVPGIGYYY